ncbi:MAG TPA: hypothetical protein VE153_22850 [Myxococcus sp.]|jgi:hypothetical protein|nr:hypothetical protein [Myxococcus sp.]
MAEPSPDTLKTAMQALYRVTAVEGPPGENGLRTVWHLCPGGAELMSMVDDEGRVRRQELTLLEDHYVWASGQGVRTGRLEREAAEAVVKTDPQLVPHRLMRAAHAMGTYTGQDRYILHMQRVLALAREGLEMAEGVIVPPSASQRPSEPTLPPVVEAPQPPTYTYGAPLPDELPPPVVRKSEGLVMVWVLAAGLVVGLGILTLILLG